MSADLRAKAGLIYNVVEAVVLGMSVVLVCWIGNKVIIQGEIIAAHSNQIAIDTTRIDNMDAKGSRGLESATKRIDDDERRLDKVESAILALQAAPGELKAINARLDAIDKGVSRLESSLIDHMKEGRNQK